MITNDSRELLASVDFKPVAPPDEPTDLPFATHAGVFHIAGLQMRCYRLNDGRAIFDADDVDSVFEWLA